jgi:uncharacterized protein
MDFEAVKKIILGKLETELDKNLMYHSVDHTRDVMDSVERLAGMEGVNGENLTLLKTAALFHDAGFLKTYDGHEMVSIELAGRILPEYGYTEQNISDIQGMIKSTEIPQNPQNHLEEIMADADLDYLGRDDLFVIGQRLQYEWSSIGKISTLREWHIKQLDFLKNHKFFTKSAHAMRESKKQENIKELEILLCLKK